MLQNFLQIHAACLEFNALPPSLFTAFIQDEDEIVVSLTSKKYAK